MKLDLNSKLNIAVLVATIVTVTIGITALIFQYQSNHNDPSQIVTKCIKYKIGNVVAIQGSIINQDTIHADRLTVKGKVKGNSVVLEASADADIIEKQECSKNGDVTLILNRLTKKAKCDYEILALNELEVVHPLRVGWGKESSADINVIPASSDTDAIVNLVNKANKLSEVNDSKLSSKARKTWLKNNSL